jgi:hypothetical protein
MSKATYEELLEGSTTWSFKEGGIPYSLSYFGYRKPDPTAHPLLSEGSPGTWCYYLHANKLMYPESWSEFANYPSEYDCGSLAIGPAWDLVDFYGGITWNSNENFWDRKSAGIVEAVKVGCDYNHSWDHDSGFVNGFHSVKADAINTCKQLLEAFPLERVRCGYTGAWVKLEDSYVAVNGNTVSRLAEIPDIDATNSSWKEDK